MAIYSGPATYSGPTKTPSLKRRVLTPAGQAGPSRMPSLKRRAFTAAGSPGPTTKPVPVPGTKFPAIPRAPRRAGRVGEFTPTPGPVPEMGLLLRRSTMGSPAFSAAELKRGYRKLK